MLLDKFLLPPLSEFGGLIACSFTLGPPQEIIKIIRKKNKLFTHYSINNKKTLRVKWSKD